MIVNIFLWYGFHTHSSPFFFDTLFLFSGPSILLSFFGLFVFIINGFISNLCNRNFPSFIHVSHDFCQYLTVSFFKTLLGSLAFSFSLTFGIVWQALAFSLVMGFVGGVLPALRASRMKIVDALRTT